MSDTAIMFLAGIGYRTVGLLVGTALAWMGYKLFDKGVFEKAGDVKAVWGGNHVWIKSGAPGTFFVVAAAVVVGVSFAKPPEFSEQTSSSLRGPLVHDQNGSKVEASPTVPNLASAPGMSVTPTTTTDASAPEAKTYSLGEIRTILEKDEKNRGSLTQPELELLMMFMQYSTQHHIRIHANQPPVTGVVPG